MIKKTITFEDFNGNQITEDFYFNLTVDEILSMEYSEKGGLSEHVKSIIASNDNAQIYLKFKDIILAAYGEKSEDGLRFVKNDKIKEEFSQTNAFSELLFNFMKNPDEAATFVNALVPQDKISELVSNYEGQTASVVATA